MPDKYELTKEQYDTLLAKADALDTIVAVLYLEEDDEGQFVDKEKYLDNEHMKAIQDITSGFADDLAAVFEDEKQLKQIAREGGGAVVTEMQGHLSHLPALAAKRVPVTFWVDSWKASGEGEHKNGVLVGLCTDQEGEVYVVARVGDQYWQPRLGDVVSIDGEEF